MVLIAILLIAALFGVYAVVAMPSHGTGCPFMPGHAILCSMNPLAQVAHWQMTFASVLSQLLIATFIAVALFRFAGTAPPLSRVAFAPLCVPLRPTLMQELFARGILHRREDCC
jgi:hypothetical protein